MISRILSQHARQLTLRTTTTSGGNALVSSSNNTVRWYVSRAHRSTGPAAVTPIGDALDEVLAGVSERIEHRAARWERNKEKRIKGGKKDDGPYRNQDETIELILNLNLDPRKPGQSLRGSLPLPHGTGKKSLHPSLHLRPTHRHLCHCCRSHTRRWCRVDTEYCRGGDAGDV